MAKDPIANQARMRPIDDAASTTTRPKDRASGLFSLCRDPVPVPGRQGAIRDRTYSAGTYPRTSLAEARAEREKVKGILKTGREPVQTRRLDRAAEVASSNVTFASVAEEWLRHLPQLSRKQAGVLMGCAAAIPEYCAVPWYLFSDFRLGNAAGRPHDPAAIPSDSRWQVIGDQRARLRCLNARSPG